MAEVITQTEKKTRDVSYTCDYPICGAYAPVHVKEGMNFCHKHYALYKFIKRIVKK